MTGLRQSVLCRFQEMREILICTEATAMTGLRQSVLCRFQEMREILIAMAPGT